jgi:hypothetical protein
MTFQIDMDGYPLDRNPVYRRSALGSPAINWMIIWDFFYSVALQVHVSVCMSSPLTCLSIAKGGLKPKVWILHPETPVPTKNTQRKIVLTFIRKYREFVCIVFTNDRDKIVCSTKTLYVASLLCNLLKSSDLAKTYPKLRQVCFESQVNKDVLNFLAMSDININIRTIIIYLWVF